MVMRLRRYLQAVSWWLLMLLHLAPDLLLEGVLWILWLGSNGDGNFSQAVRGDC